MIKEILINKKLEKLFKEYELYFVNLTFPDDYLSSSTYQNRLKMVKKYLDKFGVKYIAAQNFSKKEREYYACICSGKIDYKEYKYYAFGHKISRQSPNEYKKFFQNTKYVIWK